MSDVMQRLLEETPCSDSGDKSSVKKNKGGLWHIDRMTEFFCPFETKC